MKKIRFEMMARRAKHGMVDIYVRCRQGEKTMDVDTGFRVRKEEWDDEEEFVKDNPNAKEMNRALRKVIYDMESLEFSQEGGLSLYQFVKLWKMKDVSENFYMSVEKELPNRKIRTSTMMLHRQTFALLKRYSPKCCVADLDEPFVRGFYEYLKTTDSHFGKPFNESTIDKHMNIFRTYYHIAEKMFGNKVPRNSFSFYRWNRNREERMKAWVDDDIRKVENALAQGILKPVERLVAEQFLFMSYTGMRISDFTSMKEENFVRDAGGVWLEYTSVKTHVPVRLPMASLFDGRAEQLLYRHQSDFGKFFCIPWRNVWNKRIKRVAQLCGVGKHVSSHVARHTFATRLLNKGVGIQTIQKVVGHRKMDTTMVYAKLTDESIARQLCV